jgi:hypothetical protein
MEKKQTSNYSFGPWDLKKKDIDNFRIVTELNRKKAVVIGRILYIISLSKNTHTFRGTLTVTPCFDKGYWMCPFMPWMNSSLSHYSVRFDEPINKEDWVVSHKLILDKFISEKSLFIKPTDPILTYKKQ